MFTLIKEKSKRKSRVRLKSSLNAIKLGSHVIEFTGQENETQDSYVHVTWSFTVKESQTFSRMQQLREYSIYESCLKNSLKTKTQFNKNKQ